MALSSKCGAGKAPSRTGGRGERSDVSIELRSPSYWWAANSGAYDASETAVTKMCWVHGSSVTLLDHSSVPG